MSYVKNGLTVSVSVTANTDWHVRSGCFGIGDKCVFVVQGCSISPGAAGSISGPSSVCQYLGQKVTIVYHEQVVEVFIHNMKRIAVEETCRLTDTQPPEHMPESHLKYKEQKGWNEDDFICKAERIGEQTRIAINKLLGAKAFIEQTYDGCLGVLRLADKYGNDRLEAACRRANTGSRINYKILTTYLKTILIKSRKRKLS